MHTALPNIQYMNTPFYIIQIYESTYQVVWYHVACSCMLTRSNLFSVIVEQASDKVVDVVSSGWKLGSFYGNRVITTHYAWKLRSFCLDHTLHSKTYGETIPMYCICSNKLTITLIHVLCAWSMKHCVVTCTCLYSNELSHSSSSHTNKNNVYYDCVFAAAWLRKSWISLYTLNSHICTPYLYMWNACTCEWGV